MWEMAEIFDKWLTYVGNDLETEEMDRIVIQWFRYMGQGLSI